MSLFPATPDQFIAELERRAPERVAQPAMSRDQTMYDAGRRSLAVEMRDFLAKTRKASSTDVPS